MGRIYKRGETYYADFVDKRRRRVQKSLRTNDRTVAKARLRDLELATTNSGTHATEVLSDALDYFTETVCASKPSSTRGSYQQKARHLSRLLGKSKLDDLTRTHVERYIAKRIEEGAHTHSIHKELVVLRQTLQSAEERGAFHGVVTKVVPKFRAGYVPRETYLSEEQFSKLLWNIVAPPHPSATEKTLQKIERMRLNRILYCMIIAFASPRRGELEKLQWEHVDLNRRMMRVPKGKTKARLRSARSCIRGSRHFTKARVRSYSSGRTTSASWLGRVPALASLASRRTTCAARSRPGSSRRTSTPQSSPP